MLDITGSRCHTPPMRGAPMMPPGIIIMPGLKSTNILGPKSQCGWHDVACVRTLRYESVRVTSSNSHRAYSATPTLRKGNVQRNCRTEELLKEALSGQVLCLSLRISEFDGVTGVSGGTFCTRHDCFLSPGSWHHGIAHWPVSRLRDGSNRKPIFTWDHLRPLGGWGKLKKKLKNSKHLEVIWGNTHTHRSTD